MLHPHVHLSMILLMWYSVSPSSVTIGPGLSKACEGNSSSSFLRHGHRRDEWKVLCILLKSGRYRVYVDASRKAVVTLKGLSNLGINLATWPSFFACSLVASAVVSNTWSPTLKLGSGALSLLAWCT